jgi:hypothetical protein
LAHWTPHKPGAIADIGQLSRKQEVFLERAAATLTEYDNKRLYRAALRALRRQLSLKQLVEILEIIWPRKWAEHEVAAVAVRAWELEYPGAAKRS